MTEFDVCAGVSRKAINSALASVFDSLGSDAFAENLQAESVDLGYRLRTAPTVEFDAPSSPGSMLDPLPGSADTVVVLRLGELELAIRSEIFSRTLDVGVRATCRLVVDESDATLTIEAGEVEIDCEDVPPLIERGLNRVLLPALLGLVRSLIGEIRVPALRFSSIALTTSAVGIVGDHIVVAANLEGKGPPKLPARLPKRTPSYMLLVSDRFRLHAARALVEGQYKTLTKDGELDLIFARVAATAEICISDVELSLSGPDSFGVTAQVVGHAEAGLKSPLALNARYNLYPEPKPHARVRLYVDGATVKAAVHDLDSFGFRLAATGDFIARTASNALLRMAMAAVGFVTPLLVGALGELKLDVWTLEDVPVEVADIILVVRPSRARIEPFGDVVCIGAELGFRAQARGEGASDATSSDPVSLEAARATRGGGAGTRSNLRA